MASSFIHQALDQFLEQNPPREYINALKSFLDTPFPTMRSATWIPSADEVAIRQDLANELLKNIQATYPMLTAFTAVQVSILLLMPLDLLRDLVRNTKLGPDANVGHVLNAIAGFHWVRESMRDLIRYFLQGKHPDAATKKRKAPNKERHAVEGPPESSTHRNEAEKQMVISYVSLIEASLGTSDKAWNMISLNPYLHAWWAKPHWGIECSGIVPRGEKHAVVILFHWMPHKKGDPRRTIRVEPGTNDCQRMADALAEGSYGEGRGPDLKGYANAIQHSSFRPIVTGQEFEIALDTLEEANNMRKMINIQWACVRVAAMSGSAGPDDLDEDFSEFDFEREAFEREMMLKGSDDDDYSTDN
ncbi:hypothetical protein CMQ_3834 [Grosmannia clavigera kw1407]|uniref:HNH nuclease domain-containing protein n=1 Tax=Grosmannia clavigera (strain kw1407 / UAMH 11150) TaxID=655863 RepID=F0XA05_GROCL|nr:uncharacterized protein CMQ_3834 [Grosmannia clavigera kw1407]EFX05765.1 hypothetical protein CMQ_3834 [Grosmannia clavigera kw1407]